MNSLVDKTKPYGRIEFIHKDGKKHVFYSVVNEMTGSRHSAFDGDPPGLNDDMVWIKSVFRDIHKKATVLKTEGKLAEPEKEKKS